MARYLLGTLWLGLLSGGLAFAQPGLPNTVPLYSPGTGLPNTGTSPFLTSTTGTGDASSQGIPTGYGAGENLPLGQSPGTGQPHTTPLQAFGTGTSSAVLTAPPTAGPQSGYPTGTVTGPWVGDRLAGSCNGPVGANGPITYELYTRTGPSMVVGGGSAFSGAIHTGWMVGGGGRTLFFNNTYDAAWVLDLGVSYFYNPADNERVLNVLPRIRGGAAADPNTPIASTLRLIRRTTFNYSLGREWFLNGPSYNSAEAFWNQRLGFDIGGRWGSASAHYDTLETVPRYSRQQDTVQGVFLAANWNWERPFGGMMLFGGLRTEWGYSWTDLAPRNDSNIQDVNLLMTLGLRF